MSLWDLCIDGEWDLALVRAALEMEDVDVNKRSLHNVTLLMWAAADNKIPLLKLLLQQPSIVDMARHMDGISTFCIRNLVTLQP